MIFSLLKDHGGEKHRLLLAQFDDVSGEIVGDAISDLMAIGVANVQVIPALTKKNRSSYIFLVDCPLENIDTVGHYIQSQFTTGGYHMLASRHIFQQSQVMKKRIEILIGNRRLECECSAKVLGPPGNPHAVKVEHSSIVKLKTRIKSEIGIDISIKRLESIISSQWEEILGEKITTRFV